MGEKKTLAAQVDSNSELYHDFEEYEEQFANRSQAVRNALKDGMDADRVTRDDLESALHEAQAEAKLGSWESGALTSAFLLAAVAIAVAVGTILPVIPSFEGIAAAALLLAASIGLVVAVQRGVVATIERRLAGRDALDEPFPGPEVSD
jgi:Arc/MetJ-type ribon-helix-helix transcriptional regulator